MRLRHVKNADIVINDCAYVIDDFKEYKGKWNTLFANNNPINIEIGMGKGDFIIGMALKYPNINFIGIEKFDSVLVRAIQKLNIEIPNLRFIRMDASEIEDVFEKEIDTIYLNFSDPWPKKRHAFRRLTSTSFLKRYDNLFNDKCHIIQKTDNKDLFAFSIKSFNNYGYIINDLTLDLQNDAYPDNVETEYEKRFKNKGNPIYMIDVYK